MSNDISQLFYSRIFIEFPTVDNQNNKLFLSNLGGYTKTGDYVGCYFNTSGTNYVKPLNGKLMKCRLIKS